MHRLTEADLRLYPTIIRYDSAYASIQVQQAQGVRLPKLESLAQGHVPTEGTIIRPPGRIAMQGYHAGYSPSIWL